jgi:hypothetical protein
MKDRYVLGVGYLGYRYPNKVGLYKTYSHDNFETVTLAIPKNVLFANIKVKLVLERVKEKKK